MFFLSILALSSVLFLRKAAHAGFVHVDLPVIGGVEPGSSPASIVNYAVVLAFAFVGAAAIGALLYGGVRYLSSAGNAEAEGDAKDRIRSALFGLVFVVAAIAILNTINPDFVRLRNPGIPLVELPEIRQPQPVPEGACELTAASWNTNKSCFNENANAYDHVLMVVQGQNCQGQGISLAVINESGEPAAEHPTITRFDTNYLQSPWLPEEPGTYRFTATVGSGPTETSRTSDTLLVPERGTPCVAAGTEPTNCGDPAISCSSSQCPQLATTQWYDLIPEVAAQHPIGSGVDTVRFLRAVMRIESAGNMNVASPAGACGLMQFLPSTANQFRAFCNIDHTITCDWLRGLPSALAVGETQETVARASICMAAEYAKAMHESICYAPNGLVRDLAAGYNGGGGCDSSNRNDNALAQSVSCSELDCGNRPTRRYECLWDDTSHTRCNVGFQETRNYVARFNACYYSG